MPILRLEDADIHYKVSGSGPALLFIAATAWHGAPWELYQVPEFSRDHQVIVYDQRGTGASPTRGKDFSTRRLAQDAVALLDHLGVERAIICGHSNGGRVAQLIAIDFPDRVEKLILASAGATHSSKGIPIKMCLELVEKGYERHIRDGAIEAGCTKQFYAEHADQVEAFLKVRMANLPPLEIYLGHVVGRAESDTTSKLRQISAPTLVMVGDDEDHGSVSGDTHLHFAKILARDIAGAKFVVFPGQGHHYPFYSPQATNKAIRDFLASSRPQHAAGDQTLPASPA
jgi:pimeloyl-ACP methyl ester carboxylesterase